MPTATINDVARASGVSPATVSQVLGNGRRPVNAQTRQRILTAARALDYQPSAVAQGLAKKRMNTIGLAFPHWEGYGAANTYLLMLLDGVLNVCTRRRQFTSLCTFPHWGDTENASALTDGRCDGVLVLVPPVDCPLLDVLRQRQVPLVLVNGHDPSGRMTGVDVDNVEAARRMTEYLLGLGHRRIGFFAHTGDQDYPYLRERQEGYRQAMAHAGLTGHPAFYTQEDEATLDWGAADRPTALVCTFDTIALDLMGRLRARGVRVPEDVSIVGFDDIPQADGGPTPLTTMHQPIKQIGERATEMLLALIDNISEAGHQEFLPTELVVRQSAAPPQDGSLLTVMRVKPTGFIRGI